MFNLALTTQLKCLHSSVTDEARGGAVQVRDFKKRAKEGEGLGFSFTHIFIAIGDFKMVLHERAN